VSTKAIVIILSITCVLAYTMATLQSHKAKYTMPMVSSHGPDCCERLAKRIAMLEILLCGILPEDKACCFCHVPKHSNVKN
jgi:hypothetical protein